jgi:hypothetical protein
VRVSEELFELFVSNDFFSFRLNRLPNEGGDTILLYPNHNKTVTVTSNIYSIIL